MKQYVKYIYGCVAILLVTVFGVLAGVYYIPWTGGSREEVETVVISENQTGAEIGDVLYERGLITSPTVFRAALRLTGTMDKLQHGY